MTEFSFFTSIGMMMGIIQCLFYVLGVLCMIKYLRSGNRY